MTTHQNTLLQIIGENHWDVFTHTMLLQDGRMTRSRLNQTLRSMLNKGEIVQIEKGKYRLQFFSDEQVISCFLVPDGGIAYWSALNMHGLTEQFPNEIMIQNSVRTGIWEIPGTGATIRFIKVKPTKITGYQFHGYGNHQFRLTDPEKTLVDCFDQLEYSGGYPELLKAFGKASPNPKKMIRYSLAIGNNAVIKRIAFLYDLIQKKGHMEFHAFATKQMNKRYIPFDPSLPPYGPYIPPYHLILNIPEVEILSMIHPVRS